MQENPRMVRIRTLRVRAKRKRSWCTTTIQLCIMKCGDWRYVVYLSDEGIKVSKSRVRKNTRRQAHSIESVSQEDQQKVQKW